jgi:aspartate/methionine/tyrosine aminotransferase
MLQAMAQFMGQVRGWKATFDPDRVVMSGGATGAQETLAFCLANPGEAFLVPTPYYPGYASVISDTPIKLGSCPRLHHVGSQP